MSINVLTLGGGTKAADRALVAAKTYTDEQIALIPTPDVSGQIGDHNTDAASHADLRSLIANLTNKLNTLANSDDTTLDQMAEVVAYIKNNKSLIDGVTSSKVNVADIVNNLTSTATNKPLSAAQGKALKDAIPTKVSQLTNDSAYIAQAYAYGTSAPSNTKMLWVDTTANTGGLKYYNGSSWVHVPVAYS